MHCSFILALPLLVGPTLIQATCNRFTQSGSTYEYHATDQNQTLSAGIVCGTTKSTSELGGYRSCQTSGPGNTSMTGCNVDAVGNFYANGFTNLSLSAADAAPLFSLVASSNISFFYESGLGEASGFEQSLQTCAYPFLDTTCIALGQAGFMQYTPILNCVNGTLGDCNGGPVNNGTAISICGVAHVTGGQNDDPLTIPYYVGGFVNTTTDYALNHTTNPAANTTCASYKFDHQSAGVLSRCVGSLWALSGLVAMWFLQLSL